MAADPKSAVNGKPKFNPTQQPWRVADSLDLYLVNACATRGGAIIDQLASLFDEEPKVVAGRGGLSLAPPPTVVPRKSTLQAVREAVR